MTGLASRLLAPVAVFCGAVLLDEPATLNSLLGLVLIRGGVALGSGLPRLSRGRAAVAAVPAP